MTESRYPMKLSYITKSPLWGGRRLLDDWGLQASENTVGEAWMLTVRDKEKSVILNGALTGQTLEDYLRTTGERAIGTAHRPGEKFPLLVKLIDANDKLSVQVHPDDDYAARVEHDRGKTEMWYIVEADPDAQIIYGLKDGIGAEDFRLAVRAGRLTETMRSCPVRAGETYFIPSGMLHAIGAGILIAEIQQNCDLTYRVYDYDRRQSDGSLRQLHIDKALDVTVPFTSEKIDAIRYERGRDDVETLAHCRYFRTRKWDLTAASPRSLTVTPASFVFLLCIGGKGQISYGDKEYPIERADGYFLPADLGEVSLTGDMSVLLASID